jgi:hypothetical protein
MPEQSVIVWDIETIPDLAAAARMIDLPNAPETEVRENRWLNVLCLNLHLTRYQQVRFVLERLLRA